MLRHRQTAAKAVTFLLWVSSSSLASHVSAVKDPVAGRDAFKAALQQLLDNITSAPHASRTALQLSWKSAELEVSVSSGFADGRRVTNEDTWLFGSATKPYTAVMLMQAYEQGKVSLNQTVSHYLDGLFQELIGKTFVGLFGPNATNVTVWHLVTMQSGLPDFDIPSLDAQILASAFNESWHPIRLMEDVAKEPWTCLPGHCVYYSSTNFVLLGFVMWAVDGGTGHWTGLKQAAVLPVTCDRTSFLGNQSLRSRLTVPGSSDGGVGKLGDQLFRLRNPQTTPTRIFEQPADILGWTCGNVVATTKDVARFFWDLLVDKTILSEATVQLMSQTRPMSFGFGRGMIQYGAGLFTQQSDYTKLRKDPHWKYGDWGTTLGHGGDTYGFLSDQGFIPQLNATWAYVVNQDMPPNRVYIITCEVIKLAATLLHGLHTDLVCSSYDEATTIPSVVFV